MTFTVFALVEGLSFEDRFELLGVAPHGSGLCVATAADAGGTIVPVRVGSQIASLSCAAPLLKSTYSKDERLCLTVAAGTGQSCRAG